MRGSRRPGFAASGMSAVRARVLLALLAALVIALWWLCRPIAASAALVPMSPREISDHSHTVLVGDVISTQAVIDPSTREIDTVVGVRTALTFKGAAAPIVGVTVPGGATDEIAMEVPDAPVLQLGTRVLLFLDEAGRVVGWRNGALEIIDGYLPALGMPLAETADILAPHSVAESPLAPPVPAERLALSEARAPTHVLSAPPTLDSVTPDAGSAGTGLVVTLAGAGFGTQPGRVVFTHSAEATVDGQVIAWSDTSIQAIVPVGTVNGKTAAAGTGPVKVVGASGAPSNSLPFSVHFAYGGIRWETPIVRYRVNTNGPSPAADLAAVRAAADTWSAPSSFRLEYDGATAHAVSAMNGSNDVYWTSSLPAGVAGRAAYWYEPGGRMLECDLALSSTQPLGDGSGGTYDTRSLALHEFGHWLNLRDLRGDDAGKVMFGTLGAGERRRSLHAGDIAGVRYLYGSGDVLVPNTRILGAPSQWVSATVSVSLDASDEGGSGVAATFFALNAAAPVAYSGPIDVSAEGTNTLRYWSEDAAGNVEPAKQVTILIDTSPPTTEPPTRSVFRGAASLRLTPGDDLSGLAETWISLDGGPAVSATEITVTAMGDHTLTFWSTDRAGNVESPRSWSFVVADEVEVTRVSGNDRYKTALAVSRATFASADSVVVVRGDAFPDALAASALAGVNAAPLLLSRTDSLPPGLAEEVRRLGATRAIVVGGRSAIGDSVVRNLEGLGCDVERVAGRDRYSTAGAVAARVALSPQFRGRAFLVRGDSFADALAASPYAYSERMPVLLTRGDTLSVQASDAIRGLGVTEVTIVGGPSALTTGVQAAVEDIPGTRVAARVGGRSRYSTAALLLRHAIDAGWTRGAFVGLATGEAYPDALGGGVAAGAAGGGLVLTPARSLGPDAASALGECGLDLEQIAVYGGEAAVSSAAYLDLLALWN